MMGSVYSGSFGIIFLMVGGRRMGDSFCVRDGIGFVYYSVGI